jgi:hypothetical protein
MMPAPMSATSTVCGMLADDIGFPVTALRDV